MTASITDFSQFAELRRGAAGDDGSRLREVAAQFEALFLQTMLESMRSASIGDPLLGDSDAHELYEGMLDGQLALEMASGEGIGLAELLVRQLGRGQDTVAPREPAFAARHAASPAWENPEGFARDVWPYAQRAAEELNVAPEAVLAQAALETGWGKRVMALSDGENSFNLFGIKAGGGWHGDSVARRTVEFDGDVAHHRVASFRAYAGIGESFADYARLLGTNPRYEGVRDHGEDVEGFADALQASGYATDPEYGRKISRVAASATMTRVLENLKIAEDAPITR